MYFDFENHKFIEEFMKQLRMHIRHIAMTDGNFLPIEITYETEMKSRMEYGVWASSNEMWMKTNINITGKLTDESKILYSLLLETGVTICDCHSQIKSLINDFCVNKCEKLFNYAPKFVTIDAGVDNRPARYEIFKYTIHGREHKMKRTYTMASASNDIYVGDTYTNAGSSSWNYGKLRFSNVSGT